MYLAKKFLPFFLLRHQEQFSQRWFRDILVSMDSDEPRNSPRDRPPLVSNLNLPDFNQPLAEPWPVKMSWAEAIRHFAASHERYMREFDSPEKRWREKNPAPFVFP